MASIVTRRRSASSCASSTMLIAMESSCMGRSGDVVRKCGERGLPEADAAIVWRHEMIGPHLKFFSFKERLQVLQQQLILEDSPGKNDRVSSALFADRADGRMQTFRDS